MESIIFVSMENWDEIWRRNQFLCAGLAKRYPELRILFVGLPNNVSHQVRNGKITSFRSNVTYRLQEIPNVTITHPLKLLPNTLSLGRKINEAMMRLHIRSVSKKMGLVKPLLWLNPHYAVHATGKIGESAIIYDITDDWISLTQSQSLANLTAQQDEQLCRRADAVIVCSQKLFDLKRNFTQNLHLVPNGVDAEHYQSVLDPKGPLPADAQQWERPVLGYTGTIHPDRVDVDLVEQLAKRLKRGTLVLIGPNHLNPIDKTRLIGTGRVQLIDAIPYQQVPKYMRAFDVCITPHRVTPFTESLNPIKLWEYLAAGKPIVSTDVAGFRDYPKFVRIATDATEFLNAVEAALCEDPSLPQQRQAEARQHSWESRLDAIEAVIQQALQSRHQPKEASHVV